jgi:AraC-like DNA-binding protein
VAKEIHTRSGLATVARILQCADIAFVRVPVDQPTLVWVRRGTKIVRHAGQEWTAGPGSFLALAEATVFDVRNRPDADNRYEAFWVSFAPALVAEFPAVGPTVDKAFLFPDPPQALEEAYLTAMRAVTAGQELPDGVACSRVRELLEWLAAQGRRFAPPRPATVEARIRGLVSAQPSRAWTVPEAASAVAMSEATLRRHLARAGRTFSELLADIRFSQALTLIQATDQPIARIAQDLGYESASRFAQRFRERFGHAPSVLRGHRRNQLDRNGTEIDRSEGVVPGAGQRQ